jgi:hypothetical protein
MAVPSIVNYYRIIAGAPELGAMPVLVGPPR